jgi:hypothetical protein
MEMPRGNNAGSWWIPQGNGGFEAEDFVKALYRYCNEEATHQEMLAIVAAIAKAYADPEVARFYDALATIADDDVIIRRDGTVEEREDCRSSNARSTKNRMRPKLTRFLDAHYHV